MSNASSSNSSNSKSNVPWNPWLGVGSAVSIFFIAEIVAVIPVSILYTLSGRSVNSIGNIADNISFQFLSTLAIEFLIVSSVFMFVRFYKTKLSVLGLRRPRWSDLGWGLMAVPVYIIFYVIIVSVISALVPELNIDQHQEIGFNNPVGNIELIMTFVSLAILPPIAEEILFRGFIYSSLKKGVPVAVAVIITSVLFAVGHLPAGGAAGPLYIAAIDTFVLSLVLIYLREKTGGLWSSMLLHAIKNGVAFTALFVLHVH